MIARLLLAAVVLVAASRAQEGSWPPGTAEFPADPTIAFARLENGLRCAFAPRGPDARPPGGVSLRLVVVVGSLDEEDDERGAAHFVEHMAFNGTRRFPGASIRDWFRDRGMRIGPHANASTGERDTTYRIDLADNRPESLADALSVLREFADGILFAPDEVDAEKGVVDAEERERPPRERAETERARRLGAGTRAASRPIAGHAVERAKFTPELLRAFHRRWYRPDNMILVMAGDLDAAAAESACRAAFATMVKPDAPMPPRAARGAPTFADTSFAIDDPGRGDVTLTIFCPQVAAPRADGVAWRQHRARRHTVNEMTRWVLDAELRGPGRPALEVDVVEPEEIGLDASIDGAVIQLTCKPAAAVDSLAWCARRMAALRQQGFADGLLDRVRAVALHDLEDAVAAERARRTDGAANTLAHLLSRDRIPCASALRTTLFRDAWTTLTTAECTARFRALWPEGVPSITSIGPPGHAIDGPVFWAVGGKFGIVEPPNATDTSARATDNGPIWPWAANGAEPAAPVERTHRADLDIDDVRFGNGVHLLVKKTSNARDEIQVAVEIGLGTADVTPVERQAATALGLAIQDCGLGPLTAAEVRTFAAKHRAGVAFGNPPGAFELRGTTDRSSLAFQMEWLLAQCTEPVFRDGAVERAVQGHLLRRQGSSSADLFMRFCSELVGEAIHLDPERLAAIRADDVMQLVRTKWIGAPITVVVVGDVEVDEVVAIVGRTFGRLEKRRDVGAMLGAREVRAIVGAVNVQHDLETAEPASSVHVLAPLPPRRGDGDRAMVSVLTTIAEDRLDKRIREAMGVTYSVSADPTWLATSFRCEVLLVQTRVQPGRENEVLDVIRAVAADLRTNGPTTEEVEAAVQFLLHEERDRRTKNGYWMAVLGLSHGSPSLLPVFAAVETDVAAATRERVHEAARIVFAVDGMSSLILRAKHTK